MERRNFLIAWLCAIAYAIFPSLRPKPALKTYGGTDLREMLANNSEFRRLEVPYVIEEGVPIGLFRVRSYAAQIDRDWYGIDWSKCEDRGPGKIEYREELTGTTGGTRVTPAR